MFYPGEKCYWYSHEKIVNGEFVRRKSYYQLGCWRGMLDSLLVSFTKKRKGAKRKEQISGPESINDRIIPVLPINATEGRWGHQKSMISYPWLPAEEITKAADEILKGVLHFRKQPPGCIETNSKEAQGFNKEVYTVCFKEVAD